MKYYKTYPYHLDVPEINPNENGFHYVLVDNVSINSQEFSLIEETSNGKVKMVIYKLKNRLETITDILEYHKKNYETSLLQTEYCFEKNKRLFTTYMEGSIINHHFLKTNENGEVTISYSLDKNFELTEYRQTFIEQGYEKIFFPESWMIHKEEH